MTQPPATEGIVDEPVLAAPNSENAPDWLQNLTAAPETPAQPSADLPEWLHGIEASTPPTDAVAETPKPAATSGENAPDWLQELAAPDTPAQPSADLPEWLRGTEAPTPTASTAAEMSEPSVTNDESIPGWLQNSTTETEASSQPSEELPEWLRGTEETPAPASEKLAATSEAEPADENIPDWLHDLKAASEATAQPSEELPEWLRGTEEMPAPAAEEIAAPLETTFTDENIPDSLHAPETVAQPSEELPEWLRAIEGEETPEFTPQGEMIEAPSAEIIETPTVETSTPAEEVSETDAALAWLEGLAAKHGADEETLYVPPEQRTETPPDWISKSVEPQAAEELAASSENEQLSVADEVTASASEPEPASIEVASDLPDWLQEIRKPESEEAPAVEVEPEQISTPPSASAEMDEAAALAWLEGLAAKHGADEETLYVPPEQRTETPPDCVSASMETGEAEAEVKAPDIETPTEESATPETQALPDWLQEISQSEETVEPVSGTESSAAPSSASAEMDEAAALAWLEGLAAKHGADEETLYVPPEQRTETPPDWVTAAAETQMVEQVKPQEEIPAAEETETSKEEISAGIENQTTPELPDWLSEFAPAANAVEAPSSEETLPEWLAPAEPQAETTVSALEEVEETPVEEGIIPAAEEKFEEVSEAPSPAEEPPSTTSKEPEGDTQPIRRPVAPLPEVAPSPMEAVPSAVAAAEPVDPLIKARELLEKGNIEPAIEIYNTLIRQSSQMEAVIHDLRDAQYRYPVDISVLQALGDAYVRVNRIQDALDAYTKAEELIR
ncbi:MAG: hypothetical protein ABFD44_05960 [Anaerolineaceae bacterium]